MPCYYLAFMLAFYVSPLVALSVGTSFLKIPFPSPSATSLNLTMGYGRVNSTGTVFVWYTAALDDLSRLTLALPAMGCHQRATTTSTGNLNNCTLATNAGYFQFLPNPTFCTGNLVIQGAVPQWQADDLPMIGTTKDSTLLGSFPKDQLGQMGVLFAVSGSGVIVLGGKKNVAGIKQAVLVTKSLRPGGEEIAPRTLVAVDSRGAWNVVTIDGVEALGLGVTMDEAAEILTGGGGGFPFKMDHAINLDGGGSTTLSASPALSPYFPLQVFNRPTDTDHGPISERDVTSILCIKPPKKI